MTVGLLAASGAAAAGGGPMADAGLDQTVSVNTTVQLDATGSTHPDGDIERYEWRIETPDGRIIRPECTDCARTTFTPGSAGRYEVTVTVTGSEGNEASDTLYIEVERNRIQHNQTTGSSNSESGIDSGTQRVVTHDAETDGPERQVITDIPPCEGGSQTESGYTGGDNQCVDVCEGNSTSQTPGYATHSHVNECNVGNPTTDVTNITDPEPERGEEITITVSDYESDDTNHQSPDGTPRNSYKSSAGMGEDGHLDPRAEAAREAGSADGPIDRAKQELLGTEAETVTTYVTTGQAANNTANRNQIGWVHHDTGQSSGTSAGFQEIEQTEGPTGERIENADVVEITVERGAQDGLLDPLGLEDYTAEDLDRQSSSVAGSISDGVSDTIESAGDLLAGDDDGTDESPPTATPTATPTSTPKDTTLSRSSGFSEDSSSESRHDSNYNDRSTQDDSGDRGFGSISDDSSESSDGSSGESSGTDWQFSDDFGDTMSESTGGYAAVPGV